MDYITIWRSIAVIAGVISIGVLIVYTVMRWIREFRSFAIVSEDTSSEVSGGDAALSGNGKTSGRSSGHNANAQIKNETDKNKLIVNAALPGDKAATPWWRIFLYSLAFILVSRLAMLFIGYIVKGIGSAEESFLQSIRSQLTHWDVGQYTLISDEWYANFGNRRLALVFFPLYPGLMRLLSVIIQDSFISGLIISNLSFAGALTMLYKLIRLDFDEESSLFALGFAMFAPMAFFFTDVFSESLFLLLTLGAVYCARKRWFFTACFLGGLSTLSRLLGFIVAAPIFLEMVNAFHEEYKLCKRTKAHWSPVKLAPMLYLAFIPLALLLYFGLNYYITGNPLEFLTIQEEHWYNTRGNIFNTIGYMTSFAFTYDYPRNFDLWITQLLALFSVITMLILSRRKLRVADMVYSLAYLGFAYMSNWLLSGARYLLALYAVYPAMIHIFNRRAVRLCVLAFSAMAMLFYYLLFMSGRNIL